MLATLAWIVTAAAAWCGLSAIAAAAWAAWSRRQARQRAAEPPYNALADPRLAGFWADIAASRARMDAQEDPADPLTWPALWAAPESLRRKE